MVRNLSRLLLFGVLLGVAGGCDGCRGEMQRTAAGRLGSVRLWRPADRAVAFVFIFSDEAGWKADLDAAATHLVGEGAVVIGVDLRDYLAGLRASDDGCHYLISEIEDMSERLQRDIGFAGYASPILAGIGAGGTLAYAALAQSPSATVGGAVSVAPTATLATKVGLCEGAPAHPVRGGFSYGGRADLPGWWRVAAAAPVAPEWAANAATAGVEVEVMPAQRDPVEEMVELLDAAIVEASADTGDLPLTEIRAETPGPFFAVIYSGDGGWRDLDKQIGEYLAGHGVSVVGVDSLRYFWSEKPPAVMAADLDEIIDRYRVEYGASEVVLIGYSFGAAVLPFAVNRLAAAHRSAVVEVSLLGLEARASFSIKLTGWFGAEPGGDSPEVLPELRKLAPGVLQCFYGEEEEDSLCPAPELKDAEIIQTGGGHHFDGDYAALAEKILRGALRRLQASGR
jgi:type IV secretory pathway VirJ component